MPKPDTKKKCSTCRKTMREYMVGKLARDYVCLRCGRVIHVSHRGTRKTLPGFGSYRIVYKNGMSVFGTFRKSPPREVIAGLLRRMRKNPLIDCHKSSVTLKLRSRFHVLKPVMMEE